MELTEPDYKALYLELENAITWDTNCLNCASLLDRSYQDYCRAEIAEEKLQKIIKEVHIATGMWFGE